MKKVFKHLICTGLLVGAGFIFGIMFRDREEPEYSGSWEKAGGDIDLSDYFTDDFIKEAEKEDKESKKEGSADEDSDSRA